MRVVGKIIRWLVLLVGAFVVSLVVVALGAWLYFAPEREEVADGSVLVLALGQRLAEAPSTDPLQVLLRRARPGLRDVVDALDTAADDPRVRGVLADLSATRLPVAQIQELRDAIGRFREAGKFAYAYADVYGNGAYYLATAFHQIWLQPTGSFYVTGLAAEVPFAKPMLQKIGVEARFAKLEEYKTGFDVFLEEAMSEPFRESTDSLLGSLAEQLVAGTVAGRSLTVEQARALIDWAPLSPQEALDAGLVDKSGYWDEFDGTIDADAPRLSVNDYLKRVGRPYQEGRAIAVIYGIGQIRRGGGGGSPFADNLAIDARRISEAIREADLDEEIEAIVMRIDSGGGSYIGSDAVWRAVVSAEKPIIASMGSLAASGGYFIAAAADKIVAQPGTLTGSIGVVGGKFLTTELWAKLGVSWEQVSTGANATMFSANRDFTPEQWNRFQAEMGRSYEDFVAKVATGRGVAPEVAQRHAKGRVWTGAQALERGLVDALGGFETALRLAREAAGIDGDAAIKLVTFPRRDRFDFIQDLFDEGLVLVDLLDRLEAALAILAPARPLFDATVRSAPIDDTVLLIAPNFEIR